MLAQNRERKGRKGGGGRGRRNTLTALLAAVSISSKKKKLLCKWLQAMLKYRFVALFVLSSLLIFYILWRYSSKKKSKKFTIKISFYSPALLPYFFFFFFLMWDSLSSWQPRCTSSECRTRDVLRESTWQFAASEGRPRRHAQPRDSRHCWSCESLAL